MSGNDLTKYTTNIPGGKTYSGESTEAVLRSLRDGDLEEDDGELTTEPSTQSITTRTAAPENNGAVWSPVPKDLEPYLEDPNKMRRLLQVAHHLQNLEDSKIDLVYHTPIGDVTVPANWTNFKEDNELIMVMVHSDASFNPKPGVQMEISLAGLSERQSVVCLSAPQQIYPGVDLLSFLAHNPIMEKQAVVRSNTPSVVSGSASECHVDDSGEPTREGEPETGMNKVATAVHTAAEDFDRSRD